MCSEGVSSERSWSSQIVAFWGAVGLGIRSSNGLQSSNAITAIAACMTAWWRAGAAMSALRDDDWYIMSPGYNGGSTRLDVVLVCWSNPCQLWESCLKVAMLYEVVGRQRWLVVVVGRQLISSQGISETLPGAYWTHSPRHPEFSLARYAAPTGGIYSPFSNEERLWAIVEQHLQTASSDINSVARLLCEEALESVRATRCATLSEAPSQVQEDTSIGRHVTALQIEGLKTPFASIQKMVGSFATSRQAVVESATLLYCITHIIVCVTVGLMGAAAFGRGLAVWLLSPRIVMSKLGAEAVGGDDTLLALLAFHNMWFQYTADGRNVVNHAGDAFLPYYNYRFKSWPILLALLLNTMEVTLLATGWLYGALKVQKFPPTGVVGHGMLWLATTVAIGLSLTTFYSVYQRVSARIVGVFHEPHYVRYVIAKDCRVKLPTPASKFLGLVSDILSKTQEDSASVTAGLCLMRHPVFCSDLSEHARLHCLQYSYQGDTLTQEGKKRISTAGEYPWLQICICASLTLMCSAFGAVYAYVHNMPRWSKLVAEILLAVSATWFTTLARMSKLEHSRSTKLCHMVPTMVASAVWYVGVKDG